MQFFLLLYLFRLLFFNTFFEFRLLALVRLNQNVLSKLSLHFLIILLGRVKPLKLVPQPLLLLDLEPLLRHVERPWIV